MALRVMFAFLAGLLLACLYSAAPSAFAFVSRGSARAQHETTVKPPSEAVQPLKSPSVAKQKKKVRRLKTVALQRK